MEPVDGPGIQGDQKGNPPGRVLERAGQDAPVGVGRVLVGGDSSMLNLPLGMADFEGEWYLVSMLDECNWVRNVRAAGGRATLRRRRARAVRLLEVPVAARAPVIRRYVETVPGGRPHIPVDRLEPVEAFEKIASDYPAFRVMPL